MKRTKIKYQNIGKDKIRVVGIENCANQKGIIKEFGISVITRYKSNLWKEHYLLTHHGRVDIITSHKCGEGDGGYFILRINEIYGKQYFTNAIKWMRLAGDRLGRIVKEERDKEASQIKEIVI